MHRETIERYQREHDYDVDHSAAEKSTTRVMWLTAATMVAEIAAGYLFGSMALLADGWHMATHVAAFGIALFAYRYARSHVRNRLFTFGVGKVSVLGGFASAVTLGVVALFMALEATIRLVAPHAIDFDEAIFVAAVGLLVNLACGWMLHRHGGHAAEHDHAEASGHHHHDHNLRAAYVHVLADALTSVLAIAALLGGKHLGWVTLDPLMGMVGAAVIGRWAYGLLRDSSAILLDGMPDSSVEESIRTAIEADADNRVADLHVWRTGPGSLAVALAVVTHTPQDPAHYKALLRGIPRIVHVVVEVAPCRDAACNAPEGGA